MCAPDDPSAWNNLGNTNMVSVCGGAGGGGRGESLNSCTDQHGLCVCGMNVQADFEARSLERPGLGFHLVCYYEKDAGFVFECVGSGFWWVSRCNVHWCCWGVGLFSLLRQDVHVVSVVHVLLQGSGNWAEAERCFGKAAALSSVLQLCCCQPDVGAVPAGQDGGGHSVSLDGFRIRGSNSLEIRQGQPTRDCLNC